MLLAAALGTPALGASLELAALLRDESGISQRDLQRLGNDVLAKELRVDDRSRSLGLIGVVRLETTPAILHTAAANIGNVPEAMRPPSIQALNIIPEPPPENAFAPFQFTKTQQKALTSCRLDKCRMKLPAHLISEATREPPFVQLYRSALVELVRGYRSQGDNALWTYRDKPAPLHASDGFAAALAGIDSAPQLVPEVTRYFQQFPATIPDGAMADFMFWSVLDFGHRPTLTINHALSIEPQNPQLDYLFAIKTIYANHYFGGRASFGALLEDNALGVPGRFFVFVEHLQFDGRLNRMLRGVLSRGIVKDVETRLAMIRGLAELQAIQ